MCGEHNQLGMFSRTSTGSSPHCGEHRLGVIRADLRQGSSPHVRGALRAGRIRCQNRGIIPACAGSTCSAPASPRLTRDHPRMCGEHGRRPSVRRLQGGSSPHVRGAPKASVWAHAAVGIIPACAGSTMRLRDTVKPYRDHPRMCGEHYEVFRLCAVGAGSSPHVRGARSGRQIGRATCRDRV